VIFPSLLAQLGVLPLSVHGDDPWIPYAGTRGDIRSLGVACTIAGLVNALRYVDDMSDEEVATRKKDISRLRQRYSYNF
jgi:hypothetical protein